MHIPISFGRFYATPKAAETTARVLAVEVAKNEN
jgi:hypothetical protein